MRLGKGAAVWGLWAMTACDASDPADGIAAADGARSVEAAQVEVNPDGPRLGVVALNAVVVDAPESGKKIGYLRAGATVPRAPEPSTLEGCAGGYYPIYPKGSVCVGERATLELDHPVLRALTTRPDLSKPMPYPYAFVRAVAPNYYRVPTVEEQFKHEFQLERHLRSYKKLHDEWDALSVGANDVPLDEEGNAVGPPPEVLPPMTLQQFYGGEAPDSIPWFFDGGRKIPNIATFSVPPFAVITNRIARHAGTALVGSFMGPERHFAITPDARLIPTSKLKPERGSTWHGIDMRRGWSLPVAIVHARDAREYALSPTSLKAGKALPWNTPLQLSGRSKMVKTARWVETAAGHWVKDKDVAIASKPSELPDFAQKNARWIDVSLIEQTLVLYEYDKPVFMTAVATGRDGMGDPKTSYSTPRGLFRIREKHVTTTMDSHEVGNKFELRDVPWVQYFEGGYALHASPWHEDYGRPRSHGCINLSPIDARRVFLWTTPELPPDWHGVTAGDVTGAGTLVYVHP